MSGRRSNVLFICTVNSIEGAETERRPAFRYAFRVMENRIGTFTSRQTDKLDRLSSKRRVDAIGGMGADRPANAASPS